MPKRHYLIYCDESDKKGTHFSNFYGGALVSSDDRENVEALLNEKKQALNLMKEIKWQYITHNYKNKYIEFINLYFSLIANNKVKVRMMFTQNMFKARGLTSEHRANEFFILCYFFIKRAFGLAHCNIKSLDRIYISLMLDQIPDNAESISQFKRYLLRLNTSAAFKNSRVQINHDGISSINSKEHVILQGLDIILGAINFRLNDRYKEKPNGKRIRGKRTRAKEEVYRFINKKIRELYPNFNIGVSTAAIHATDRWGHPYRHWKFVPRNFERDKSVSAKRTAPQRST
jgi:hypothetical protein